jgi:hypothetical protein
MCHFGANLTFSCKNREEIELGMQFVASVV